MKRAERKMRCCYSGCCAGECKAAANSERDLLSQPEAVKGYEAKRAMTFTGKMLIIQYKTTGIWKNLLPKELKF